MKTASAQSITIKKTTIPTIIISNKIIKTTTTKISNKFLSKCQISTHRKNVLSLVFPTLLLNKLPILLMFFKHKSLVKLLVSSKEKLIKSMEEGGMLLLGRILELMLLIKEVLLCILLLMICTFVCLGQDD